jgi:hypothetical protein
MPLAHATEVFDVEDCKVWKLLSDSASASPTYGPAIDVPGIAEVGFEPNVVSAELKGDATVIARKGRVDRINATLRFGKVSLDVLEAVLGGLVSDTGSAPNQESTWTVSAPGSLPYFKLGVRIVDVAEGIGSVLLVLYKCQLTSSNIFSVQSDQFGQPQLQVEAIRVNGSVGGVDGAMATLRFTEQVVSL